MPYTALYRKFRPRSFDAVIGQEHIVRTLRNQLLNGRVSHAYLFCGTRGTGKTSTAKIFARAINCETPVADRISADGQSPGCDACGECRACKAIDGGYSLNVIEIDAASNNSVDNVRDIREEVKYPPAEGRYKVYIIDEVHMLSAGAFNALLKTLEEPPEHVVFILATTDPQKIPATVHSRCQRFDFRRVTADDISRTLSGYMAAEGVDISADALDYIARVSDGSMRDALSVLDQCTTFYFNQPITLDNVLDIVGSVDDRVFFELADALYAMAGGRVMEIIAGIVALGRDVNRFVSDFVVHLRNLLVAGSASAALDLSAEAVARLSLQADALDRDTVMRYINTFSALQNQMRYAVNERILFEVCCLRLCSPDDPESGGAGGPRAHGVQEVRDDVDARLRQLEAGLQRLRTSMAEAPAHIDPVPSVPPLKKSVPADIEAVCKNWDEFTAGIKHALLRPHLIKSTPAYLEGGALILVSTSAPHSEILKKYEPDIKAALAEKYEREFELRFIPKDEYDERHRRLYGVPDSDTGISKESFTDKVGMDIIIED